jgi:hypothetical protein
MKFKVLVFFVCFAPMQLFSQAVNNMAFQSGESLRFKGSYYMSSLWADLAEIKIDVKDQNSGGKVLYAITATVSTYSNYDSFFKIRDYFQTMTDKSDLKPYLFIRNVDEGGFKFSMKYTIRRAALQAKYDFEQNGNKRSSVIKIQPDTHDFISVLYYIRTLDFEKMPVNKVTTISLLVDEKINYLSIKYKGKETIKTETFGNKACYKLGVSINHEAVPTKETNNIWLTADKNKIPVFVKADIPVGSIQMRLVEAKGIKP